ncbi:MAG: ribosome maturation factor RimM [Actinobacteria bacterium]|nr:ribosome maturation factor RimM [Actinomycetota bacterium]
MIAGEIGKPHGIGGDVYVVRISDDPRRFEPGAELIHSDGRTLVVEHARPHRDRFLVKFEGVNSREDAEAIRGTLFVPSTEVRDLAEGEFWESDLIGCEVFDVGGAELGRVAAVIPGPAQDLLELDTTSGSRLVPLVQEFVVDIDPSEKRIVIDPPEGLFE